MNLALVHRLLLATTEQRHGFLKISNTWADRDVEEMVRAGLVEATLNDGDDGGFTAINRVTGAGHAFLRAFEGHTFSASGGFWESQALGICADRGRPYRLIA